MPVSDIQKSKRFIFGETLGSMAKPSMKRAVVQAQTARHGSVAQVEIHVDDIHESCWSQWSSLFEGESEKQRSGSRSVAASVVCGISPEKREYVTFSA